MSHTLTFLQLLPTQSLYTCSSHVAADVVVVSSIDYGLFILQLDMAAIEAQKQSDVTLGEEHRYRAALPGSDITACPPLVERRVCVPEEC